MITTNTLKKYSHPDNNNLKIVISISGPGDIITVNGKEILKHIVKINGEFFLEKFLNKINIQGDYIFIIQEKYDFMFGLKKIINSIMPDCKIIVINEFKNGAALTLYELKNILNFDSPILFLNSDFIIDWEPEKFINQIIKNEFDACLVTYKSNLSKHSYCEIINNQIINVVEKEVISDNALVGIYFWSKSKILFNSIEKLINNKITKNGQYYLSLTFNQMLSENYRILNFPVSQIKILDSENDLKFLS